MIEIVFGITWFIAVGFGGWLMGGEDTRGLGAIILTIALFGFIAVETSRGKRKNHYGSQTNVGNIV